MNGDLVTLSVHLLDRGIVGVLVRHEEGCLDITAVWIFALAVEDIFVQADVVVVDGVIEGDRDHLRYILGREVAGYRGTVLRAEAVGQGTHGGIARWSSIGIIVHVANILIGAVSAVFLSVTEETPLDTGSVTTREISILAEWFLGIKQGLGLPLFVLQFAIVDRVLPIAGLLVDVEVQAGRASYRLQTGTRALDNVAAVVTFTRDQSEPLACILVLANLALEALFLFFLLPLDSV